MRLEELPDFDSAIDALDALLYSKRYLVARRTVAQLQALFPWARAVVMGLRLDREFWEADFHSRAFGWSNRSQEEHDSGYGWGHLEAVIGRDSQRVSDRDSLDSARSVVPQPWALREFLLTQHEMSDVVDDAEFDDALESVAPEDAYEKYVLDLDGARVDVEQLARAELQSVAVADLDEAIESAEAGIEAAVDAVHRSAHLLFSGLVLAEHPSARFAVLGRSMNPETYPDAHVIELRDADGEPIVLLGEDDGEFRWFSPAEMNDPLTPFRMRSVGPYLSGEPTGRPSGRPVLDFLGFGIDEFFLVDVGPNPAKPRIPANVERRARRLSWRQGGRK